MALIGQNHLNVCCPAAAQACSNNLNSSRKPPGNCLRVGYRHTQTKELPHATNATQDERVWGWWSLPRGSLRFCMLWFPVKSKQIKPACQIAFIRVYSSWRYLALLSCLFPHVYTIKDEKQWAILIHRSLLEIPQGHFILLSSSTEVYCFCNHILSIYLLETMKTSLCNLLQSLDLYLCVLLCSLSFAMCAPDWPLFIC